MNPLVHVLSTVLVFVLVSFVTPLPIQILLSALFLTIGVDIFDHGIMVATLKHPTTRRVRNLISQGRIIQAYRLYYSKRRRTLHFAFIHNLPVTAGLAYITIHYQSAALALGLLLHLGLDLIDHYRIVGDIDFWFN
ncbi:MAG: hypothetical protein ABH834_02360 [Candidatus Altiarchaeota archaeon]